MYWPTTDQTKPRSCGHRMNGNKQFDGKVAAKAKRAKKFVNEMLAPSRRMPGRSLGLDAMQSIAKDGREIKI